MKCYIMFCVANLRKNMMTLFKIYHIHYLSSIIVNLLQLRHVYHITSAFDMLIFNYHSNSIILSNICDGEWRHQIGE